jgi:hypothetical protein
VRSLAWRTWPARRRARLKIRRVDVDHCHAELAEHFRNSRTGADALVLLVVDKARAVGRNRRGHVASAPRIERLLAEHLEPQPRRPRKPRQRRLAPSGRGWRRSDFPGNLPDHESRQNAAGPCAVDDAVVERDAEVPDLTDDDLAADDEARGPIRCRPRIAPPGG